jgi:hypothetical protein
MRCSRNRPEERTCARTLRLRPTPERKSIPNLSKTQRRLVKKPETQGWNRLRLNWKVQRCKRRARNRRTVQSKRAKRKVEQH